MKAIKKRINYQPSRKARFFTLIEVMICVAILLITASFFSYKLAEILSLTKTQKSMKQIASRLDLCKRLAFYEQSDVVFKLFHEDDILVCQVGTEGVSGIIAHNFPPKQKFSGIDFSFKGASDSIEISFSSTGSVFPTGILYLSDGKKIKKKFPIRNKYITSLKKEESFPLHPKDAKAFADKTKPVKVDEEVSVKNIKSM